MSETEKDAERERLVAEVERTDDCLTPVQSCCGRSYEECCGDPDLERCGECDLCLQGIDARAALTAYDKERPRD